MSRAAIRELNKKITRLQRKKAGLVLEQERDQNQRHTCSLIAGIHFSPEEARRDLYILLAGIDAGEFKVLPGGSWSGEENPMPARIWAVTDWSRDCALEVAEGVYYLEGEKQGQPVYKSDYWYGRYISTLIANEFVSWGLRGIGGAVPTDELQTLEEWRALFARIFVIFFGEDYKTGPGPALCSGVWGKWRA
jgi:hypothetical protein